MSLEKASRRIKVSEGNTDAGVLNIVLQSRQHTDKFGKPYSQHPEVRSTEAKQMTT